MIIGIVNKNRVINVKEENRFITFIWSCTNFWLLRPMDYYYPLKVRKSHVVIHGVIELAVLAYFFGKQEVVSFYYQIHSLMFFLNYVHSTKVLE